MHEYREDMGTCDDCGQPPEQHGQPFSPAELADLRIIRGRAMMDRGDIAPMQRVSYRSMPTNGKAGAAFATSAEVIPWLDALNMEVD